MADLQENADNNADNSAAPAKKASAERIKKMRAWLGGQGPATPDSFTAEDEALYYGDGHSGWNR